jgi:hypothetical protein
MIRERTIAGLTTARARGRKGGRPAKLTAKHVRTGTKMLADPEMTIKEVAKVFDVNRATIYRSLGLAPTPRSSGGGEDRSMKIARTSTPPRRTRRVPGPAEYSPVAVSLLTRSTTGLQSSALPAPARPMRLKASND